METFGHHLRDSFTQDPTLINLNIGSFGAFPKVVLEAKEKCSRLQMENPDKYYSLGIERKLLNESRAVAADLVGVKAENIVWCLNVTHAFNSVYKSFDFQAGDEILFSNLSYTMNKQVFEYERKRHQIVPVKIIFTVETLQSDEAIIAEYEKILSQHQNIKFINLDHISSMPSIKFPLDRIISLVRLKAPKAIIFVDGAHALGAGLKVNISELDCDFYSGNFHKWGFTPRPACILYFKEKFNNILMPSAIGSQASQGVQDAFYWQGTLDQTSYVAVKTAIEYLHSFGQENVINYLHSLAVSGAKEVARIWNTDLMCQDTNMFGNLVMVRSPVVDLLKMRQIVHILLEKHNIKIYECEFDGKIWVRLSCMIYHEVSDFVTVAQTFLKVKDDLDQ